MKNRSRPPARLHNLNGSYSIQARHGTENPSLRPARADAQRRDQMLPNRQCPMAGFQSPKRGAAFPLPYLRDRKSRFASTKPRIGVPEREMSSRTRRQRLEHGRAREDDVAPRYSAKRTPATSLG